MISGLDWTGEARSEEAGSSAAQSIESRCITHQQRETGRSAAASAAADLSTLVSVCQLPGIGRLLGLLSNIPGCSRGSLD